MRFQAENMLKYPVFPSSKCLRLWHKVYVYTIMNRYAYLLILSAFVFFSSCEVVEGIFKAGFLSAVILGVLLIVLVIWIANRFRRQ
jgi:hypothetical protein